ncbi:MAG: hypothetical protein FWE59_02090 [Oscillospiraceae bacterium]|nr:hypothetical protein [Oscillospiraceae bacterium]
MNDAVTMWGGILPPHIVILRVVGAASCRPPYPVTPSVTPVRPRPPTVVADGILPPLR